MAHLKGKSEQQENLQRGSTEIDLGAILALQIVKVGVRELNYPTSQGRGIIIDFIRRNFNSYTSEMINEAFDMAICGKLDIKDASCYENFSCEYVGRILGAYKQHLIQSGKLKSNFELERQTKPMEKNLLDAPKITDDEIIDISFQIWKSKHNWKFISINAFKILMNQGKIVLTESEKDHFRSKAKMEIMNEEHKDSFAFKDLNKNYYTQMYAAKLATESYFKTLL